ncbi:MAG: AI-2E family transporter, partial [Candidatus Gracilibacteria bacterium]|nr:AI-2E family transporter [Candidatus Gracilibacteria bacterium]
IITLPQKLTQELTGFANQVPIFNEYIIQINQKLLEIRNFGSEIGKNFNEIITENDITLIYQILDKLKVFGIYFLKFFIALILSFIFIIDRDKLSIYLKNIEKSNFGFFYTEYKIILEKIVKTFGAAFKAQSFIALANAALTTIGLLIIGFSNNGQSYPFIYTLAIIVFLCGFIPIIGLFISSIPVFIIGFTMVGGISVVIQIIILLIIINIIETYYLNPKIVSRLINLPISLTFVVLVISEHFLGFAGLILGIGFFYLLMELLKDTDIIITKSRKILTEISKNEDDSINQRSKNIRLSRKQ